MSDRGQDINNFSMLDLFQMEVETQAAVLNEGLLVLETPPQSPQALDPLIRVTHSVKGAARLVEIDAVVQLAHIMEDCFVAAQNQTLILGRPRVNVLRRGVDLLLKISQVEAGLDQWLSEHEQEIESTRQEIADLLEAKGEKGDKDDKENASVILLHSPPASLSPEGTTPVASTGGLGVPSGDGGETPAQRWLPIPPLPTSEANKISIADSSMLDLFRLEVEAQAAVLNEGLLALESQPQSSQALESLMRAAHSVKGAARIVAIDPAVQLAHVMEDCFVAAQKHTVTLGAEQVDVLLRGVDLLLNISQAEAEELNHWLSKHGEEIATTRAEVSAILTPGAAPVPTVRMPAITVETTALPQQEKDAGTVENGASRQLQPNTTAKELAKTTPAQVALNQSAEQPAASADRTVRVSAENLNRIMGLAGESLIEANWLQPFADSLTVLRKRQLELAKILENLQNDLSSSQVTQDGEKYLAAAREKERECREFLGDCLDELELFARRTTNLSDRLYREVIASHMRPFADGVQGFPRMIRDLARHLSKQVKLEILGKTTPVDRDILKKLEAPLTHILRNSVDHGIELPEERLVAGKPAEGMVKLEAVHRGGMLAITISDDGRGINLDWLRQKIVSKNLETPEMVAQLSESELMEFLFLAGFSTAKQVTEISGRGVGLDIAKSMAQEVGGTVRAVSQLGKGTSFHFQLPLTLSVVRTLLVEISGEPYAFPLARIAQIVMVNKDRVSLVENRPYFTMDNRNIGLVAAHHVLELKEPSFKSDSLAVVVIGEQSDYYGLVVDRFLGEHDLVVRPLDPRLGKVQDISAAALTGDGSPILIVDVSDLVRSIDNLLNNRGLSRFQSAAENTENTKVDHQKSILVVDDSITVREMERRLLENKGYRVDVAVNGVEGWHAVSANRYDLVISDIDMPRMNGIEFVTKIKHHPELNSIPVIIVSYKDREEDRMQGLTAGANYYLTKASFHDDTLVNVVIDLIGA